MTEQKGFIIFTRRAGGTLETLRGTLGQFQHAVEDGYLTYTDWSRDDASEEKIEFESIMWAPPVQIMRPIGPGGALRRTDG